jgi:hypothetical protein
LWGTSEIAVALLQVSHLTANRDLTGKCNNWQSSEERQLEGAFRRKSRGYGKDKWRHPGVHSPAFMKSATNAGANFRATKRHIACVNKLEKWSLRMNNTDEIP